jgi:hypothetical protein
MFGSPGQKTHQASNAPHHPETFFAIAAEVPAGRRPHVVEEQPSDKHPPRID